MRIILVALIFLLADIAVAQHDSAPLEKYVTDDVVAIAYLDLSQIDTLGMLEWAEEFGVGPESRQRANAVDLFLKIQQQLDAFSDYGARYVYALFRVSDIAYGGPTWVVPVAEQGNPRAVLGMILSGRPDRFELELDARPGFIPQHCEVVEGAVLGANSAEQLELLKNSRTTVERDLATAWETLGNGHCGLIIFGNRDSRRVVREMFPRLPTPFEKFDGPLIADRLLWGGVVVDLPPEPRLEVILQTDESSSAQVVQKATADGLALVTQMPFAQQFLGADDLEALAASLTPQVAGDRLFISFDDVINDLNRLAKLLTPPVKAARQAAQRKIRINKFKQIVLAMHNYHDSRGTFPPRGTYSDDGKPLLSWRVHILPYLGEEELELYKQFRLDESWNSDHNKQLIPLMPEVYADPDPVLAERNAIGRTTFVVPTGQGTVFQGSEGTLIKQITDGLSNTIMLVEVWSMAGPYWTRPKDWLVDVDNPAERLPRGRDWFTAGYCDGHVNTIPLSTPHETLRALLTIAGGEVVQNP